MELVIKITRNLSGCHESIHVQVQRDRYFAKEVNLQEIGIPPKIMEQYQIQRLDELLIFKSKKGLEDSEISISQEHSKTQKFESFLHDETYSWEIKKEEQAFNLLKEIFSHVRVFLIKGFIDIRKEDIYERLNILGSKSPVGVKFFGIAEGKYEKGSFLVYFKITNEIEGKKIREGLRNFGHYLKAENLYYPMEDFLKASSILRANAQSCLNLLIQKFEKDLQQIAAQLGLVINQIDPFVDEIQENERDKKVPIYALYLKGVTGNRNNIQELYFQIQKFVNNISLKLVQLQPELILPYKFQKINELFPEISHNIHKVGTQALILVNVKREVRQIEKKIYVQTWKIDKNHFPPADLKKLRIEHQNRTLIEHLMDKGIMLEERLVFEDITNYIEVVCDKKTKEAFINQCKKIIDSYIQQEQDCYGYDNSLVIGAFKKYYSQSLSDKYDAVFTFKNKGLMRVKYYNKCEEKLKQQLTSKRNQIQQNIVSFVTNRPVCRFLAKEKSLTSSEHFLQTKKPEGYLEGTRPAIGSNYYFIGKKTIINILLKPFESLKLQKQENIFVYLLSDSLSRDSLFHQIIANNSINFQGFMASAHATKKPQRLIKYYPPNCQFSKSLILMHTGRKLVSQTLKRDFQKLLQLLEDKVESKEPEMHLVIPYHEDQQFIEEVFPVVLQETANCKEKMVEESHLEGTEPRCVYTLHVYYEGQPAKDRQGTHINREYVKKLLEGQMQKIRNNRQKIVPRPRLVYTESDLMKIYCLNYVRMRYKDVSKVAHEVSPAIAYFTKEELSVKRHNDATNRIIISLPEIQCTQYDQNNSKLTQDNNGKATEKVTYLELVFCTTTKKCFQVIPNFHSSSQLGNEPEKLFSPRHPNWTPPSITTRDWEDIDRTGLEILHLIQKYLPNLKHTVLNARIVTDGKHWQQLEYSNRYYELSEKNKTMRKLIMNWKEQKIEADASEQIMKFGFKENQMEEWYETIAYNKLVEDVCSCLKAKSQ